MERRMALAIAAAGALMSATGVVRVTGMLASDGHAAQEAAAPMRDIVIADSTAETTTSLEPVTVTETRDVFDTVVVPTAPAPPVAIAAAPSSMSGGDDGENDAIEPESATVSTPPSQTAPGPTTTTTTAPSSPPMPAGCIGGQLEDNGTWNCQSPEHDD